MQYTQETEAETIATLLSGFQGSLTDLLVGIDEPNLFRDFSYNPDGTLQSDHLEQLSSEQISWGINHNTQKRSRALSDRNTSQHGLVNKPKKMTPTELTKLMQNTLILLEEQQAENVLLKARHNLMEQVLASREDEIAKLKELQQYEESGAASGAGAMRDPVACLGLTMQDLRKCKLEDMLGLTKASVLEMAARLMTGPGADGGYEELGQMVMQKMEGFKYAMLVRPDFLLLSSRLVTTETTLLSDPGGEAEGEEVQGEDDHWASVISHLSLTPEQARDSWLLMDMFRGWHNRLLAERARVSAHMVHALAASTAQGEGVGRGYPSMVSGTGEHEARLLDRLQHSLVKERCLICLVCNVWWESVLTPVQCCQAIVHCYPRFPDDVALISASAELYHAPHARGVAAVSIPTITPARPTYAAPSSSRVITTL